MRRTLVPNNYEIQVAIRDGLGITSPSERNLFELDRNGSLPDMNSFLRSQMPELFNHFAKANPWISTVDASNWQDGDRVWPYALLARAGRSLAPAILNGHADPTMSDFRDNSGRPSCPDGERVVFLGKASTAMSCPVYVLTRVPTATVASITEKTRSKWAEFTGPGMPTFYYVCTSPMADDTLVGNEQDDSSEDDMSVEVISPPRRPVTRSVSAKRAAEELEPDDNDALSTSPSPRPRKARKVTGALGRCTKCHVSAAVGNRPIGTGPSSGTPLFLQSQTPEPAKVDGAIDTTGADVSSHLNEGYFESENPWEDTITYF